MRARRVIGIGVIVAALIFQARASDESDRPGDRQQNNEKHALFLYDGGITNTDGMVAARAVANLMGHFGFKAFLENLSAYSPGGATHADAVFVFGMAEKTKMPESLLEELKKRSGPTVWTHLHLNQLTSDTNVAAGLGFAYDEDDDEARFTQVLYHGLAIPNTDNPEIDRVRILNSNRVEVIATARDEDAEETVPYVLRSGQFWYFAGPGSSFTSESDVSIVMADLLHDILGVQHPAERRAMVRIEDVSANSDPEDLKRVADILAARHVPFQIALIPIFVDPNNHITQTISEAPEVVDAIKYMVAHGGTVIMHGITHQLQGVSGDDYEFWDALANHPTSDGALNILGPRVQRGIDECFRAGLYPLAFETPHYGASMEHYRSLATIFGVCYERRMLWDGDNTQQYVPYVTTDIYGQKLIPENLGYVPIEKPDSKPILSAAARLEAVRDPIASFFFHPFMPAKYLEQILDGMQHDGYRFISLKEFSPRVVTGDYAISAEPGSITISPQRPFLKVASVDAGGHVTEKIQAVESGRPFTLALKPPAGGIVAVQSLLHAPTPRPDVGWFEQLRRKFSSSPADTISASGAPAHEAIVLGSSPAFESVLSVYGIPWHHAEGTSNIPNDAFVVIPHSANLSEATQKRLADWIRNGGRAVLEERSPLAEKLGFTYQPEKFLANRFQDILMPSTPVQPTHPPEVERFIPPSMTAPLVEATETELPVMVASRVGDGTVIYLGTALDSDSDLGYTRLPFLFQHLRQRFGIEPPLTSDGVEFYFDPGFREKTSLEKLVNSWHAEGVRAIYAAAWHFYPNWTFDYNRLIHLCHQQGIAVYAWLELPEVSPKFWNEHAEWREKTVTGLDAQIGWRQFMNLANPDCRAAALKFVDDLLSAHDWDGVNIAEMCFDTEDGLSAPGGYIPMNDTVCAAFQRQNGFDPRSLFATNSPSFWKSNDVGLAQWNKFRCGLTRDWLAETLDHVRKRKLDVIVTALDSLSVPSVIEKNGCDSRDVIGLMDRYPFTLQVEDPDDLWGESPTRFAQFGETYRKLVRDSSRLMFDINVVNSRPPGLAPTKLAVGTELALTVHSASTAGNGRVAVYSESTVLPEDREVLPFVLGASVRVKQNGNTAEVTADRPVRLQYATPQASASWANFFRRGTTYEPWPIPSLDGQGWTCGTKGLALMPAGTHRLGFPSGASKESIWIKDITASFTSTIQTPSGFVVDYDSPRRAWLTLSREPSAVLNDGQPWHGTVERSKGLDWLVELPAGHHRVELQRAPTASVVVERAGEEASLSIAWIGTRGIAFLAVLYFATRLRRGGLWLVSQFKGASRDV